MTEKQREAAIERLAVAREKILAARGCPKNVSEKVYNLPESHYLSYDKVKSWIKSNKEQLSEARRAVRSNVKGAIAESASIQAYIRNMEWYIRTGDWIDNFYGEHQNKLVRWRTAVPAYDKEGVIKGSHETESNDK